MRFRPCIDIHNGKVKQIVGGSLQDEGDCARENFASPQTGRRRILQGYTRRMALPADM